MGATTRQFPTLLNGMNEIAAEEMEAADRQKSKYVSRQGRQIQNYGKAGSLSVFHPPQSFVRSFHSYFPPPPPLFFLLAGKQPASSKVCATHKSPTPAQHVQPRQTKTITAESLSSPPQSHPFPLVSQSSTIFALPFFKTNLPSHETGRNLSTSQELARTPPSYLISQAYVCLSALAQVRVDDDAWVRLRRRRRAAPDVPHVLVLRVRPGAPHHLLPGHRRLLPALLRPLPPRDRPAAAPRAPAAGLLPVPPSPAAPRRATAPLGRPRHRRRGHARPARTRVPPAASAGAGARAAGHCTGASASAAHALPTAAATGRAAAVRGPGHRPGGLLHGRRPQQPRRGAHAERPARASARGGVGHRLAPHGADHRRAHVGRRRLALAVPRVQGGLRARGGRAAAAVQARLPLRLHRPLAPPPQLMPRLPLPAASERWHHLQCTSQQYRRGWWCCKEHTRGEGAADDGEVGALVVDVATTWDRGPGRRLGVRPPRARARQGRRRRRRRFLRVVALSVSSLAGCQSQCQENPNMFGQLSHQVTPYVNKYSASSTAMVDALWSGHAEAGDEIEVTVM